MIGRTGWRTPSRTWAWTLGHGEVESGDLAARDLADGVGLGGAHYGEVFLLSILVEERHCRSHRHLIRGLGVNNLRVLDKSLQGKDTAFHEGLVILGVIVFGIVDGASLFFRPEDLVGHLLAPHSNKMLQLSLQLGQPF